MRRLKWLYNAGGLVMLVKYNVEVQRIMNIEARINHYSLLIA